VALPIGPNSTIVIVAASILAARPARTAYVPVGPALFEWFHKPGATGSQTRGVALEHEKIERFKYGVFRRHRCDICLPYEPNSRYKNGELG